MFYRSAGVEFYIKMVIQIYIYASKILFITMHVYIGAKKKIVF